MAVYAFSDAFFSILWPVRRISAAALNGILRCLDEVQRAFEWVCDGSIFKVLRIALLAIERIPTENLLRWEIVAAAFPPFWKFIASKCLWLNVSATTKMAYRIYVRSKPLQSSVRIYTAVDGILVKIAQHISAPRPEWAGMYLAPTILSPWKLIVGLSGWSTRKQKWKNGNATKTRRCLPFLILFVFEKCHSLFFTR